VLTHSASEFATAYAITLEELVKLVPAYYAEDPTAAGITISWVEDEEKFYASVCRFREPFGKGKQVLACEYGETLEGAIRGTVNNWCKVLKRSIFEIKAEIEKRENSP